MSNINRKKPKKHGEAEIHSFVMAVREQIYEHLSYCIVATKMVFLCFRVTFDGYLQSTLNDVVVRLLQDKN